jgi:hypothetical protein
MSTDEVLRQWRELQGLPSEPYHNQPPFVAGSETSEAAASRAKQSAETMRARVLEYITAQGEEGATDDEVEVALGMLHQTASARRRELELSGHIQKTDWSRPTRTGSQAAVYCVSEHAPPRRQMGLFGSKEQEQ